VERPLGSGLSTKQIKLTAHATFVNTHTVEDCGGEEDFLETQNYQCTLDFENGGYIFLQTA
jgi:hypothetical protein